jgi:hypothetical protein
MSRNKLFSLGVVLGGIVALCTGCVSTLRGGGEVGVGFRSDSMLILRHTVDGDKQEQSAQAELALDPSQLVLPKDPAPEQDPE